MKILVRAALILLAILVLTPLLSCAIEYRLGEREAEHLFNYGIGEPWVGGDPPHSQYWSWPGRYYSVWPYAAYKFRGASHADHGFGFWSGHDDDLLSPWPRRYPLYRHDDGGKNRGMFFYSETSGKGLRIGA